MKILENLKKNTILLVLITVLVLYFVLKDDFIGIVETLKKIDIKFILIAILFYIISVAVKGYVNYLIINDKKKISIKEAINQNMISQFFNGVTPFSTGGEPMAVYMLTEKKISLAKATNYMVQSFIFYQIALVVCGLLAVTYNFIFKIYPKVKLLQGLVLLGFSINVVVVCLLLLTFSKKNTEKLSHLIQKMTKKLKIKIKEEEIEEKFREYHQSFEELKKRKILIGKGIILNMVSLICLYLVPIFIVYGMGDYQSLNIADTLVSSAYVYLIGAFVPIPGASGGIEYGFTQFFGNFLSTSKVSAVLIVWRSITYYLGMIIGAILFNIRKKEIEE